MFLEKSYDWEEYLHLVLYVLLTTKHATTGITPFQLMYGREFPNKLHLPEQLSEDILTSYERFLSQKLAFLRNFAEENKVQ